MDKLRILDAAHRLADERAEDTCMAAWRALDSVRLLPPHQLRRNVRALLEIRQFIEEALDGAVPEMGEV